MQDYYLGLDLGTGSLGWAVTSENYEVMRAHGKALWGVRLFETANTAEERRVFRTNRRRLARRNWRLDLLQGLFADEINKVDDGFYLRLKESRYLPEDKLDAEGKTPELPYALFVDSGYTDKEYHKQFPTIYHLRKWLMETDKTPDVRLVYLALHHMMKHRGHFLFANEMNIEEIKEVRGTLQQMFDGLKEEELDFKLTLDDVNLKKMETVLRKKDDTKSDKKKKLIKELGASSTCEKEVLSAITGGTATLSKIFENPELDQTERPKFCFADAGYDEYASELEVALGEQFVLIERMKAVYDWSVLADLLGDSTSLSEAKVAQYEKHRTDLRYLKDLVKEQLGKDAYREVFVKTEDKLANYTAYIGMTKINGKKRALEGKQCTQKEFYDFLKKNVLQKISDKTRTAYLEMELEKGTFLPKQVTKDNSVIPHQLHLYELDKMISNLKDRVPLLAQEENRIRSIFTFRIPYYVGPLNGIRKQDSTTNWARRKTDEKVYPWNFEDVIDIEASAERFIRRMTNKCTYLPKEDVLPKHSLLYSKFEVLNELNNLRINGELISVELKQNIYTDLFQRHKKVTQKKVKDYLVRAGIVAPKTQVDITGIDGEFKSSLGSYIDLKGILTDSGLDETAKERIILDITLFGDDKALVKKRLRKQFSKLSDNQINQLARLSYKGWGRLSGEFLNELAAPAPETGEKWTILRAMWETNENLMQLLSDRYGFMAAVEKRNGRQEQKDITYQMVEELYVSPAVKRQIWQTMQIVKELCDVLKQPPKRVFVEVAREKGESKRTESRKKKLQDLYKACKQEEKQWIAEWLERLENTDDHKLRSDRLYLYYTQQGRCMYTGEPIELADLWNNQMYDIDHIYPQSRVMDDSLNNRVLVKRTVNAEKSDVYPLPDSIYQKMKSTWKMLLDRGFIEKEKYNRLVRREGFSNEELSGFISRQLVETRQSTKAVASLLKQVLPDTEIVYVKANTVSQFRQDFGLIKVREMNDLHHAKDAYLNIVVGNGYYTKFTKNAAWYINQNPGRTYNLKKMFTSEYDIVSNGEIAWKAGADGTIGTVKRMMQKNNILVTRRSYQVKGGFFDQMLMKKGKGQVAIKASDNRLAGQQGIDKYGGYNKATGSYFMLVASEDKKENQMRTIEYVPLYLCGQIEESIEAALRYLRDDRGLINPRILLPKIKIDTLFKVDGFYMWLSGRTGDRLVFKGANQLLLPKDVEKTLKKVLKYADRYKENKNVTLTAYDGLEQVQLVELYDAFLYKLQNSIYKVRLGAQGETLQKKRDAFLKLTMEEQCLVLAEILHLFQCQSGAANLKLIGGPGNAGILVLGNNVLKFNQFSIINQSPTGIYEQEIDLLKL
ncbi:MAG: type II CRISPR RNA-guided endonuclease Cas9 [Peptococcaceae bacterium]|nr:type II CRISPR RNA-guided endonuclease Cas9 [Peptococcaceae bacterium]